MMPRLILASASPRRRELLERLGLPFDVVVSGYDEAQLQPDGLDPADYVTQLAAGKAAEVATRIGPDVLVIGADTTVVLDGVFLNKPTDAADARRMLRTLSGRTHQVYTGLCLVYGKQILTDSAVTDVIFDALSDETIAAYVATGEPLDKAGAYGIQGKALSFIPRIHGDYFNVVGLPLTDMYRLLLSYFSDITPPPAQPKFPNAQYYGRLHETFGVQ